MYFTKIRFLIIIFALFNCVLMNGVKAQVSGSYDIIIVGATPAGIMTAISASRMGKTVLILERTTHIGGLPANGLGATDIVTKGVAGGLFLEFVTNIKDHYIKTYGANSQQVKDCSGGYHFEASVAEAILTKMLSGATHATVKMNRQFDSDPANVTMVNGSIRSLRVLNRESKKQETYQAKMFIDATYEGDLIAAAKVPFVIGREGKTEFNEPYSGKVYKNWDGSEQGEGSTNSGDNAIQAYNYRICLTNDPLKRVNITKPENYDRSEYLSLINDVKTGNNTSIQYASLSQKEKEDNVKLLQAGLPTVGGKIPIGISQIVNMVTLPNGKTDANNQHLAFISTDLPEENWAWPSAGWEWRDKFAKRLREYNLGLIYFAQNDSELPELFKKLCREWGLSKDEYQDNENFPRQVYVREGRRMKGKYFFTAHDALAKDVGGRATIHPSSVTASHYYIDSHGVLKRESDRISLDGFLSYQADPYTVPYECMVPPNVKNLLAPVPVSGSHLGFSTLRMEPCWMALGQAAGIAASLAITNKTPVQNISVSDLQRQLLNQGAMLVFFKDVKANHPQFKALQYFALKGVISGWEAKLDEKITKSDLEKWEAAVKTKLPANFLLTQPSRAQALDKIYQLINAR
jgi:hypothetical protein